MPVCSVVKVRGFHLDIYGHVNHARYLEFMEDARWEFFQHHLDPREWRKQGLIWVVANVNISYRRPADFNEVLEVTADLARIGNRSAVMRQLIRLRGTETVVTEADVTFVIVNEATGRAVPLEGELRALLESLMGG